ncbi:MAG: hypothetical protein O2960_26015 [Verrucomicrobia bacterium]|nr:hypothetical protein [Verrucomicrobiota bacterium]
MEKKNTELTIRAFTHLCKEYCGSGDYNIEAAAERALNYFGATKSDREVIRPTIELERRWYDSIEKGEPDFSVYDEPVMLSETWACWRLYSRKYLALFSKQLKDGSRLYDRILKMGAICDLGCGPGITTLAMREMFPSLCITGTQLATSMQFKLAKHLAAENSFEIAEAPTCAGFVFASEYFEHFENPVEHLREVLSATECRLILFANAFGAKAVGHFNVYKDGERTMSAKETSRAFNLQLRASGFQRVETGFWNNRPSVFEKIQQAEVSPNASQLSLL